MPVKKALVLETLDLIKHINLKATKNGELSPLQIRTLVFIKQKQCVKPSLLAKEFNVTPATITTQIDKLVQSGWLERCYDENDRRVVNISLTKKATQEVDALVDQTMKRYDWICQALNKREQEDFLRLVIKLHDHVHADRTR